jgi:hypothetical protein
MMTLLIPRLEKAPKLCGAYFLLDLDSLFNNVETAEGNDCILFDFLSNSGYFVSTVLLFSIFGATLHVGHLAPMEHTRCHFGHHHEMKLPSECRTRWKLSRLYLSFLSRHNGAQEKEAHSLEVRMRPRPRPRAHFCAVH